MRCLIFVFLAGVLLGANSGAATIATLSSSVGIIELELYDEDKPVTVSNFIKYAQSGRYSDSIVHRWITNFVFQAGGFFVSNTAAGLRIAAIPTFGEITNEYNVGRKFSNAYGTIAMARQGGRTNSATSQWFINVTNNAYLDTLDGGFTVFGRVISGTNVVNLFIPPSPSTIYRVSLDAGVFKDFPGPGPNPDFDDLIYTDWSFRRDLALRITSGRTGKTLSWNTVASVTNAVEYSTNFVAWNTLTNVPGSGAVAIVQDASADPRRSYRIRLGY